MNGVVLYIELRFKNCCMILIQSCLWLAWTFVWLSSHSQPISLTYRYSEFVRRKLLTLLVPMVTLSQWIRIMQIWNLLSRTWNVVRLLAIHSHRRRVGLPIQSGRIRTNQKLFGPYYGQFRPGLPVKILFKDMFLSPGKNFAKFSAKW